MITHPDSLVVTLEDQAHDSLVVPQEDDTSTDQPSIIWPNLQGDVTITWDERNKEQILEYARKKMEEGYSFFIIKPKKLFGYTKDARHKVTAKNFDKLAEGSKGIVIQDEALQELVNSGMAQLESRPKDSKIETKRRVTKESARDLLENHSYAMKPLVGG